jgi:hypothetical protein
VIAALRAAVRQMVRTPEADQGSIRSDEIVKDDPHPDKDAITI